jgi:hypothetical protein
MPGVWTCADAAVARTTPANATAIPIFQIMVGSSRQAVGRC